MPPVKLKLSFIISKLFYGFKLKIKSLVVAAINLAIAILLYKASYKRRLKHNVPKEIIFEVILSHLNKYNNEKPIHTSK